MVGSIWERARARWNQGSLPSAATMVLLVGSANAEVEPWPRAGSIQRSCPNTGALVTVLEGRAASGCDALLLLPGPGAGTFVELGRPDLPSHLLLSECGLVVAVWAGEALHARWCEVASTAGTAPRLASATFEEPLDDGRAPAFDVTATGAPALLLPLKSGALVQLDLATGNTQSRLRTRGTATAESIESLDAVREADPTAPDAWAALTRALHREGEDQRAREVLGEAVETLHGGSTQPVSTRWSVTDVRARLTLSLYEERLAAGNVEGASETLDDLERLYPCMEEAVLLRAELVLQSAADEASGHGAADECLRAAIGSLVGEEQRAAAHVDAARFLEEHGALDQAVQHLGNAVALGEEREIVLRSLARIEAERGNGLAAAAWLERLRARWSSDFEALRDERRRAVCAERIARLTSEIEALR